MWLASGDNCLPVAFATALLLGLGRRLAGVSGLAEVLWEIVLRDGGAVGETSVVTVSSLVGAGHCNDGVSHAIGVRMKSMKFNVSSL
jgi:hypothetical protein